MATVKDWSSPDSTETEVLLAWAVKAQLGGEPDREALSKLLERHRDWLMAFIDQRIDGRLNARVDAADLLQEVYLVVHDRLGDYLCRRPVSFRTWLMKTAFDCLGRAQRRHVIASSRTVLREISLHEKSSHCLVERLVIPGASPQEELGRAELAELVRVALLGMSVEDREVLLLRYVEELDNQEIAFIFGISPKAVSKRHGRALLRLQRALLRNGVGGWYE